jgi:hypothetical protein
MSPLGAELGVAAGRPEGAYDGGSGVDPDETLALDLSSPPARDAFWNAPFGAAAALRELPDASAVTWFFAEGRERAGNAG